jgi:hypothetical protein
LDAAKERDRAAKEQNRKSKEAKSGRFAGILGTVGIGAGAGAGIAVTTGEVAAVGGESEHAVTATAAGPLEATTSARSTDVHHLTTVAQPEEASQYSEPVQRVERPVPAAETAAVEDSTGRADRAEPTSTSAPTDEPTIAMPEDTTPQAPSAPKGDSKVKTWLKSRFRTSSKAQKDMEDDAKKPGFIGGAALTAAGVGAGAGETGGSPDRAKRDSVREVAMVGRSSTRQIDDLYGSSDKAASPAQEAADKTVRRSPSISTVSSSDANEEDKNAPRGRLGFKERFLGKSAAEEDPAEKKGEVDEARDRFDEEKLAPLPKLSALAEGGTKSSNSPSSRERSKFKEDL